MKIYPTILAHNKTELEKQLSNLKWAKHVQLDIMDGHFVPTKTYSIEKTAKALKGKYVQVHLMVRNPQFYLHRFQWADEIIYHAETGQDLVERIQEMGIKAGICFNPNTKVADYEELIRRADIAQIMTVYPGQMGAKYLKAPLQKITQIKKINPDIIVGVDGGVSRTTINDIVEAGADYAGAGSSIQKAEDPKKAYQELSRT